MFMTFTELVKDKVNVGSRAERDRRKEEQEEGKDSGYRQVGGDGWTVKHPSATPKESRRTRRYVSPLSRVTTAKHEAEDEDDELRREDEESASGGAKKGVTQHAGTPGRTGSESSRSDRTTKQRNDGQSKNTKQFCDTLYAGLRAIKDPLGLSASPLVKLAGVQAMAAGKHRGRTAAEGWALQELLRDACEQVQRDFAGAREATFITLFLETGGNMSATAAALNMSREHVHRVVRTAAIEKLAAAFLDAERAARGV
jgi:hypothetical protein